MFDVSVVIPCFNGEKTLEETLLALVAQEWDRPWEIVLSDNASTDRSVEIFNSVRGRHPSVSMRCVDSSAEAGQPFALNVGVKESAGRSIVFCDADDVVAPGWLAAMGGALETHPFVAARMDFQGVNEGWWSQYRHSVQETRLPTIAYPPYLHHAGGGTIGFRREVFDAVGGFDSSLPILHDTDFCFRAQLKGYDLHFVENALIHIRLRSDWDSIFKQAKSYAEYNVLLAKRYRHYARPRPQRWMRFTKTWIGILRRYRGSRGDPISRARYLWEAGWHTGLLVGILKHRAPPP